MGGYMATAKTEEWVTPDYLFREIENEFGPFNLDPCATTTSAKAPKFYTEEDDGREREWFGKVYVNPPFSLVSDFVEKAWISRQRCEIIVLLLPARTDTRWFHSYLYQKKNIEIRFLKGRVRYGNGKSPAPFPSMLVIIRKDDA